jgi:uncharacterized protein YbcI
MASQPAPEQHLSLATPDRREAPSERGDSPGDLKVAISARIIGLLRKHTGKGPTHAKTTLSRDLVVISLAGCLTTAEQGLVGLGQGGLVRRTRSALYDGMRGDAIALIEELTDREVTAYLTDQQLDPDLGAIVFVLSPFSLASA